ncbi:MAG: hypothetical protein ACR5K7_02380 [Symbiopectobacterium sp.]
MVAHRISAQSVAQNGSLNLTILVDTFTDPDAAVSISGDPKCHMTNGASARPLF